MKSITPDKQMLELLQKELIDDATGLPIPYGYKQINRLIDRVGRGNFIYLCYEMGFYLYPTLELLEWLRAKISDKKKVIEVGSGNNGLNLLLGIRGTDNYCQQLPEVQLLYQMLRQKPTNPGKSEVEKIDAEAAITKYKPNLVIACWLTPKFNGSIGNHYGPDFKNLVEQNFIMIGNQIVHDKFNLNYDRVEKHPFLVSRSSNPATDIIYIWENKRRD